MDMLKRFVRGFCSQAFKLSIYLVAVSAAVITVFGTPTNIKDTLKNSGVYGDVVSSVIDQAKNNQTGDTKAVPIDNPEVQAAIKNALPPDYIEQNAGQAIDGIFSWLQGRTETPQFAIDLNEAKQRLATGVADAAYSRAIGLPPCTASQLQNLDRNNIDIFTIPCLPPGVNLQAERDKLASSIASNDQVLDDATISSEDLPKENGQNVFDRADAVPTLYQWFVRSPWILAGLALVTAAGLLFLHDDRRRGLLVIGRALLVTGIILVVSALLVNYVAGTVKLTGEAGDAQAAVTDLIRTLARQFNDVLIKFGAGYALVGAGILLGLRFTRPKVLEQKPTPNPSDTPVAETPATPDTNPAQPEEKTKE